MREYYVKWTCNVIVYVDWNKESLNNTINFSLSYGISCRRETIPLKMFVWITSLWVATKHELLFLDYFYVFYNHEGRQSSAELGYTKLSTTVKCHVFTCHTTSYLTLLFYFKFVYIYM